MSLPIESIGTASESAASAAARLVEQSAHAEMPRGQDQVEARSFATFMNANEPGYGYPTSSVRAPDALHRAAQSLTAQYGNDYRTFEDIRASMVQSVDFANPIRTMFTMTNLSIEAQASFTRLHLSSSLASAATSLFGNLLKNQQ
ncbi:hypothetical protein [Propionivibrio soli]|uniref:hypothetical protein n=1 Tax=Propionivibrio soli TaxID=2976531 RepID=UPI0021E908A6|nr:hypothetical protein [Propionivibrio soli]